MSAVPEELVEKAARAINGLHVGTHWLDFRREARAALEAVGLPALLERVQQYLQLMEAATTELSFLRLERDALAAAGRTLLELKDGPRDAAYYAAKKSAWDDLRAALTVGEPK